MKYKVYYYLNPPTKRTFKRSICDRLFRRKKVFKTFYYPFFVYDSKRKKDWKGFPITDFGNLEDSVHQFKKGYNKTLIILDKKGKPV